MEKSLLAKLLVDLNANLDVYNENLEELFQKKYEEISKILQCAYDDIVKNFTSAADLIIVNHKETYAWKCVCLNFYILDLLNRELSKSNLDVLSVQEIKNIKIALQNFVLHGILKNLQPNLPYHVPVPTCNLVGEESDVLYNYIILKSTVLGLYNCIKCSDLRMLILPHCLQAILVAVYQIAYCPLKKPANNNQAKFVMTEETYKKLLQDKILFKEILENMSQTIHPSIFIKETMILFQKDIPLWFKKAISNTLTKMMRSKKGVQHVAYAMLNGAEDDTTTTWKILDVLIKLILSCRQFPDFKENICTQVLNLLELTKTTDRELLIFERLVVSCTKCLYSEDKELCKVVFVERIVTPLQLFVHKEHKFRDHDDITDDIKQTVRLLHGCFVDDSVNSTCLPMDFLRNVISVIFYLYHLTENSSFQSTNKELKEILIRYLRNCTIVEMDGLLDNFLFGITVTDVSNFRNDLIVQVDEKIVVKNSSNSIIYATADVLDTIYNLLDADQKIILFGYLLKCITNKEKYFLTPHNSKELLGNEDHATSTVFERLLTIHKVLSQLSENKEVQCMLRNKPDDIIDYINNVLSSDKSDSGLIFIIVMILDNLLSNASKNAIEKYRVLMKPLSKIALKTTDAELKSLCNKIITALTEPIVHNIEHQEETTEFDKALKDVYDPLLPTRGHGLLVLSKLIEKKDKKALERKQYLLNLFQLYLKDEDSFIYLNAVQGLSALADIFPDTVLEILCEEYADFSKKGEGANETRMKLGEVLVRVVKLLGEMAVKYKALLLNTFLSATKDDDHLIRSSSLSNLGEVCRVLNYKLGTIVTEVLVCVHAIIATDKAVEARRAAVTVIRQLFVGLQSEMLAFLKEDILPIYRTLKEIYYNDRDDVMRLQAQLALEELNENMKAIVFPNPELHFEKKIIMMD